MPDFINAYTKYMNKNETIEEPEATFYSMFNAGPYSAILVDKDKRILIMNKNAEEEMGQIFEKPLRIGEFIENYIPKRNKNLFNSNFNLALHGEAVKSTLSFHTIHGDVWYDLFYTAITDKSNETIGVYMVFWPVTNMVSTQVMLLHQLEFVNIISKISSRFLYTEDLDQAINSSLADIGTLSGASRAYIFMYSSNMEVMNNTHEWCAEDVSSQIDALQDLSVDLLPWWNRTLHEKKLIKIENVSELPSEASNEKKILEQQDIKSLVVLPIYEKHRIVGFIGFDNVINSGDWQESNIELLRVCSEIFSNAIQRKHSEKVVTENEYKYRQLFNNTGDLIFVNTIEDNEEPGFFIEVNDTASERLGYSKLELQKKKALDIMDAGKASKLWFDFYIKNRMNKFTIQIDLLRCNHERIPCEVHISIFELFDKKVVLSIARDISERIENEKEMHKLTLAIEHSPSSVIISDKNGIVEYVNPKFTEITGYSMAEIKGKHIDLINSGRHHAEFYKRLCDTINSGKEWGGEVLSKKKNGELYWENVNISPIKNSQGEILHFVSLQEDITERKKMEEEIHKRNSELLELLEKLKKAQSVLVQQEKLAAIGQLSAGIAHEINNPMGFVMSNFDTLKHYVANMQKVLESYRVLKDYMNKLDVQDKPLEKYISDINDMEKNTNMDFIFDDLKSLFNDSSEGMERVSNIVKSLKWFAHKDNSDEYELYDLTKGIQNTLLIARNEIKYYAEIEAIFEEIPLIEANGQQINQIILNIILNAVYAIKSMQKNKAGRIKIRTYRDNQYVYCEIEDNGPGIPREIFDKIFEPFVTSKPIGEGTGLGLSMAKDTIERHNGEISARNVEGSGALFIIKLPIRQNRQLLE